MQKLSNYLMNTQYATFEQKRQQAWKDLAVAVEEKNLDRLWSLSKFLLKIERLTTIKYDK